ncbi:MAG TPA: 4,5-DOPA dioxygenase extradiol [Burkholderiales bacterium]|nr:4,5-DOPA dioxygenase extradiol [Burkholderiales bacterium]
MSGEASTLMPALFVGHGSPMNTLTRNRYTSTWAALAKSMPKPRALLVISAHWYIGATAVTAMARPRTIHDFYGFPRELFAFQYPAPGAPQLAQEIAELVKPTWVGLDGEQWGLDHGTWSVLAHMYPNADVPVVQLAINASKPPEYHLKLGASLASLRARGVAIIGSGNVVHNLHLVDPGQPESGFPWARRFDDAVHQVVTSDASNVLECTTYADYALAAPTPDHFLPLLYIAGVAGSQPLTSVLRGYSHGSLSMTAYAVGLHALHVAAGGAAAALPRDVPADQTNT